jgi:phosphoenolpyruvate-protein phosphotransferase
MPERVVRTKVPLHARPLDRFVRAARGFSATVRVTYNDKSADGRNVLQLLLLAVPAGAEITIHAEGTDAGEALAALAEQVGADPPAKGRQTGETVESAPVLRGVPGASGAGVGVARFEARLDVTPPEAGTLDEERGRLERAFAAAEELTTQLVDGDDPFCDIFGGQLTLLGDPALRRDLLQAVQQGASARAALVRVFSGLERQFDALESAFAADRHADVADVRDRLLDALTREDLPDLEDDSAHAEVLVLHEATPSRLATLDTQRVAAVISERGGPTSHAAIVARGRGIPLVFIGAGVLEGRFDDGQWLHVDGDRGTIEPLAEDEVRRRRPTRLERPLDEAAIPCATTDGKVVRLRVNLGAPGELAMARRVGAEGCGLLRTELLYVGRAEPPTVLEQSTAYTRVARALAPDPVLVRLFDAGSDKPLPFLPADEDEPNPALGQRGLRLLLRHREVLEDQLLAIQNAREQGADNLRAMIPMVTDLAELEAVDESLLHVFGPYGQPPPLGAMIETPAAALLAGSLARRVDFLSIGSNDLRQYTLASDRASTSGPSVHPAELALIARAAAAAREAGIECGLCGELAGDPHVAPLLCGLGITSLSMAPPRVVAVRAAIRCRAWSELEELARRALALEDPRELEKLINLNL